MNAAKLRKLKGTTLERATRTKALEELGAACKAVQKPINRIGLRYSKINKARQRYIYGLEDEAP
jgi:hypothetical protein